ncbi:50S ribosomal protein L23 [Mycoplasma sp. U97]|uniref:50S ribosomal protein L23 n=1 Tax=Mycoplasma tauri TaxID=547987 RepID=UPI001CBAAC53|nr:50S ribosomal protein L23 [Mycoplasma tauri]MBZ4212605.1 50S ribosomal protein L23 [Mycoplasma tauri]
MEITRVIRRPILTEKSNVGLSSNVYTFEVDYTANKYQIKKAVEFIFKVKVVDVNTIKVDKKPKNLGRFHGFTNRYKKAMVKLAEGFTIAFYPQEETQDAKKESEKAEEIKATKAKAEAKEAKVAEKLAAKKASKKAASKKEEK